ncbi:MAG: TlpA disulfide reductase family protein [Polyangiaceae bacterium]
MTDSLVRRGGAFLAAALLVFTVGCSGTTGGTEANTPDGAGDGAGAGSDTGSASAAAPDFTLPALDGSTIHLSDYKGKVVLIDFWSTTCDPCLAAMPHLVDLYKSKKDSGFVVLAISLDGPESRAAVSSVVHDKEMIFPILLDEETSVVAQYNPKREMPYSVLVGKDGSVAWKRAGYQPGSEVTLTAEVEKALAK